MALKVATLQVDVTVNGVAKAMAGLRNLNETVTKMQKHIKGTLEGTVKLWAALRVLTSSSAIAGTYIEQFQGILGNLIDSILLPILPILDFIIDAFYNFSDWFQNQGPLVKAIGLGLGLAFGLMWLGVGGPLAIAIAGFAAFGYWFIQKGPVVQGIVAALAVAFGIFWAIATGGLAPLIAGLVLLVGWLLKVTGLWDKIKEGAGWIADKLGITHSSDTAAAGAAGLGADASAVPSSVTTNTYNMNVSTTGSSRGGRDAAIAAQAQMAMANRMS